MNEQENLLELYEYITDRVNTKHPDISEFDRDDIIQDVYLKTYITYLNKYQEAPKYKRNAYLNNYVKRYVNTFLAKQQSIVYLQDYLQDFPECEIYSPKEYVDIINKDAYDKLVYYTHIRGTLPERRLDMTIQHIVNDRTLSDIAKQYQVTQERIRQQIAFILRKFRRTAYFARPYTDNWLENTDIGYAYQLNGFITTTDFMIE